MLYLRLFIIANVLVLINFHKLNAQSTTDAIGMAADAAASTCTPENCEACASCGSEAVNLIGQFFNAIEKEQSRILLRKPIHPFVTCFDLDIPLNYQPSNYFIFQPNVRVNFGIFGIDLAHTRIMQNWGENKLPTIKVTNETHFLINFVNTPVTTFRIGNGVFSDYDGDELYYSFNVGLQFRIKNRRWIIDTELKSAKGFLTGLSPRTQVNFQLNKRILNGKSAAIYAQIGAFYHTYYETEKYGGATFGFLFKLF